MQSPFFFPDQGQIRNLATYNQFLNFAGASSLAAARTTRAESLRVANYRIVLGASYGQFGFGNDVDFTDYVRKLFPAASLDAVSYITNTVYPPPKSARVPYETNFDRAVLVTSDVVITCNTYLLARAYQNKTYNYLFNVPPGLHGDDLHYTFGPDSSVKSERVRLAIQDYVMSFTATRSPNSLAQPSFPMYGTANQALNLSPASIEPKPDTAASARCLELQKHVWS
ncbi:MAG: hypothetical protein L6R38_005995 [Xanthoria sp. 2 TBL-2021]|nr:MAG: hypothetical protein L6R38_005995 [Xanthoria sp. 2 TBL-2021]